MSSTAAKRRQNLVQILAEREAMLALSADGRIWSRSRSTTGLQMPWWFFAHVLQALSLSDNPFSEVIARISSSFDAHPAGPMCVLPQQQLCDRFSNRLTIFGRAKLLLSREVGTRIDSAAQRELRPPFGKNCPCECPCVLEKGPSASGARAPIKLAAAIPGPVSRPVALARRFSRVP